VEVGTLIVEPCFFVRSHRAARAAVRVAKKNGARRAPFFMALPMLGQCETAVNAFT
jgi:hypothetical protein